MKLAILILMAALASGTAMANVAMEAHHNRAGELKRHADALVKIEEAEIDAKAAFQKESLRCGSASACLKTARDHYNATRKQIQARRVEEDALHRKYMLLVLSQEARKGGCM